MANKFKQIIINGFSGGISPFQKAGVENSARFMKNLNPHEDPNYITQLQKTTKVSGSTVTGLVLWMQDGSPWDDNKYFYDWDGKIYRETSAGVWSSLRTVSSSTGDGLLVFDNYLYYTGAATFGRYGRLDGTPTFSDDFLNDGSTNLDDSQALSGNTYTLTTGVNEGATHRQTFTPTKAPIGSIQVLVASKGTGNWTVVIHDSNNVVLDSVTISNGSLTNSAYNTFGFGPGRDIVPGNNYHFHVYSTVADGTITTGTASDLETSSYKEFYQILVNDLDWHPMIEMDGDIIIANGRYLAKWSDQSVYNPNAITFPAGYKVRSLTKIDEYIVAAVWRGTNIDSSESGRIYFWDNIESTYNFFVETTGGAPNVVHNSKNRLFSVLGSSGTMYLGYTPFQQVSPMPKLGRGKKVEVYPGGITEWQGNTLLGVSGSTDDSAGLVQGVYSYGNSDDKYPEALSLAYTMSTGTTQATTASIGCVFGVGKDLYFSWRDGSSYGVDKVIKTDSAFNGGQWESLIFDGGSPLKPKMAGRLFITFEALTTGQSVTPKYDINRTGTFTTGTAASTVGDTHVELPINTSFKEIQFGFNLASSSNTNIIVTSVVFEYAPLDEEDIV